MLPKLAHNIENKLRTDDVKIKEEINFSSMLLSLPILRSLEKNGFKKPSPIQFKAIPMGRFGYDLIVKAKSGTGKTAVFGIIALEMIDLSKQDLQVLILAPTREIAVQIQQVITTIGEYIPDLKVEYFIGGSSINEDYTKLQNCHIAVGAPGRVKSLIKSGKMKTQSIHLFVLDEADKLLETNFQSDVNYIYNKLSSRKQIIATSATYTDELKLFLSNYMLSPTIISADSDIPVLIGIKQYVSVVESHLNVIKQMKIKTNELVRILQTTKFNQCIVFCNYQVRAETVSNNLTQLGWPSIYISGAQKQKDRLDAVDSLKNFKCRILSTTDLTARGIDAANVDLVINYEVPIDSETYLHRMGRAGRYGSNGLCITIAAHDIEVEKLQKILGTIGGSTYSILKINKNLNLDIWKTDENEFEKFYGIIKTKITEESEKICDTLKELSVKTEDKSEILNDNAVKILDNLNEPSTSKSENISNETTDIEQMLNILSQREQLEKNEIESKLNNLNTNSIFEMLQSKLGIDSVNKNNETNLESTSTETLSLNKIVKKSKNKKVKINEMSNSIHEIESDSNSSCSTNIKFDNEAMLFQRNNILHKNLALHNITKLVVEQDSVTDENVQYMENLLNILEEEDKCKFKAEQLDKITKMLNLSSNESINHISNAGDGNSAGENISADLDVLNCFPKWETIREYEVIDEGINICMCHQNFPSNAYSYAISKTNTHWQNTFCKLHPYKNPTEDNQLTNENKVIITKEEFFAEAYDYEAEEDEEMAEYYETTEDYYDAVETQDNKITWDEDIFIKSYDYALHSETRCDSETFNDTNEEKTEENSLEPFGYASGFSETMKSEEFLDDSSVTNNRTHDYESYFDYYHNMLTENAPYFENVEDFEEFFKQWQIGVTSVRKFVQEDIYNSALENQSKELFESS